jgi:hypothetical protein
MPERKAPSACFGSAPPAWRRARAAACVVLAAAACRTDADAPELGNTGPGATVARVVITEGPTVLAVGDTAYFRAQAYDNANQSLPVRFTWLTSEPVPTRVELDPSSGTAVGLSRGSVLIYAQVGSKRSDPRGLEVR